MTVYSSTRADRVTAADYLSIIPALGQIIGVFTVLSNTVKVICDLGRAAITGTWKGDVSLYERRVENLNDEEALRQTDNELFALPGYRAEHHARFILIGILRALPVIGTLYSLAKCCRLFTVEQTLDDPRIEAIAGVVIAPCSFASKDDLAAALKAKEDSDARERRRLDSV